MKGLQRSALLTAALFRGRLALVPQTRLFASVTGRAWEGPDTSVPIVTLYTKEGCTLCDVAKDVLSDLRNEVPHTLDLIDIEDDDQQEAFEAYKYDIPVLKIENVFWTKHRITPSDARTTLLLATDLKQKRMQIEPRPGEPNAALSEQKAASRRASS
uniref:Glutaredoxin-like protein n=1 Tax=Aureoumbra lagunensis TaxID=44058 RepID=A0A7S3JTS6_9STRA|mmetsp:Transcript_16354/g.21378  ORF Transcript_16354/g.21378 Transcript_16354/m.21378 type:complete len:157 (-) Transcript_16354:8-478(-)